MHETGSHFTSEVTVGTEGARADVNLSVLFLIYYFKPINKL